MSRTSKNAAGVKTSDWLFFHRQNIYRSNNELYLIRWELFRCPWFSIKVHKIILSDDACLHDHPWSFLSIILWGGYYEWRPMMESHPEMDARLQKQDLDGRRKTDFFIKKWPDIFKYGPAHERLERQWHGPLSILYRKVPAKHCIEIGKKPAWTLVFCAPKTRSWGFHTKQGFVSWREHDEQTMKCD